MLNILNKNMFETACCMSFNSTTIASSAVRNIYTVLWEGNISLADHPRPGCPLECDEQQLQALIGEDPRLTTRELSTILGCNQSTIDRHLNKMGSTSTDTGQHPTEDLHLHLFIIRAQSMQVSPANRHW